MQNNIVLKPGYPANIARIFRVWFQWGFLNLLAASLILIAYSSFNITRSLGKYATPAISCFCCMMTGNLLTWLTLGAIWRFGKSGQVASGVLLKKTPA